MRIVVLAYACEPGQGSEPGAGWAWARMIAQLGEVSVVTRANNRTAIEAALAATPERDRLHFVYMDLPPWAYFWKRGQRGIRLYYLLWQLAALRRMRREHRERPFDWAWHLTLANAWLGSTAAFLPVPFVYGPVGGTVTTPCSLLPVLGPRGVMQELTRSFVRGVARYLNPLARVAWHRASIILVQNRETREWLPRRHRRKAVVFPNTVFVDPPMSSIRRRDGSPPTALFAGRLVPWKGVALAIRALSHLPEWRLLLYGNGPAEHRLRRLARRLGVADRVVFAGFVPRPELLRALREEADVFLFPSLRDEVSWAAAEAASCGVPVVCLERGGPPTFSLVTVAAATPRATAKALAEGVLTITAGSSPTLPALDLESRVAALTEVLRSAGMLDPIGVGSSFAQGRRGGARI